MSSCVWPPDMTPGAGICLGMSYSCLTPSVSLIYCPSKLIYLLLPGLLIPRLVLVSTELFSCNTIKISITSLQRALSIFPLVLNDKKSKILIFLILTFLKRFNVCSTLDEEDDFWSFLKFYNTDLSFWYTRALQERKRRYLSITLHHPPTTQTQCWQYLSCYWPNFDNT